MCPEENEKSDVMKQQEDFLVEQQINAYSAQLPQVSREDSDFFFKEIVREQSERISYVQIGFRVASLSPDIYDLANVIINDIHCFSQENLKIIIDGDDMWVTSTLVYPYTLLGDLNYNIMEANHKEALIKSKNIMQKILERCRQGYQKMESDQQILKDVRKIAKNIKKAFKDPNSDY